MVPSTPLQFKHVTSDAGSITLTWLPPRYDGGATVQGYHIYYKIAGVESWSKTDLISADNFSFTVDPLSPDN